jgi:hypothetical protein
MGNQTFVELLASDHCVQMHEHTQYCADDSNMLAVAVYKSKMQQL